MTEGVPSSRCRMGLACFLRDMMTATQTWPQSLCLFSGHQQFLLYAMRHTPSSSRQKVSFAITKATQRGLLFLFSSFLMTTTATACPPSLSWECRLETKHEDERGHTSTHTQAPPAPERKRRGREGATPGAAATLPRLFLDPSYLSTCERITTASAVATKAAAVPTAMAQVATLI